MDIDQIEKQKNDIEVKKKTKKKSSTSSIKIKSNTSRKIRSILNQINKKKYGNKVLIDDLLLSLLDLIDDDFIKNLQESTLSNEDKIERAYQDFLETNEGVNKDEFLGILLSKSPL